MARLGAASVTYNSLIEFVLYLLSDRLNLPPECLMLILSRLSRLGWSADSQRESVFYT